MQILLVRHGLPIRVDGQPGQPADPELSAKGWEQARRLSRWLRSEPIDTIVSSPLRRAVQTAGPLADALGLEIQIENGVTELDHDAESYVPLEEVKRDDPERWRALAAGELYAEADLPTFQATVVATIERLIQGHPGGRIAVFCHGGVINAWACHVLGLPMSLFLNAAYTSVNRFLAASSGERSIASLNEAAHIDWKRRTGAADAGA
ncbi:histidine phosphatase family protein [Myxococcota bacterium]|nr:histidine phosphatase family protein [Myxococcota bacterium]